MSRARAPVHEPCRGQSGARLAPATRRGKESFYAQMFAGKKMPMAPQQPQSDNEGEQDAALGHDRQVTN